MTLCSRMLGCIAAGLACMPGCGWAQADALKHDPFARPAFLKATPPPGHRDSAGVGRQALPEPAWKPELAAIMLAGPRSVVSIDGTIVRIGEEINGHRLVEVHEQSAVFVKNKKRVTLSLRDLQLAPAPALANKDERGTLARPNTPLTLEAIQKPDDRGTAERREERKLEK
jgi:hypothetical protein